MADSQFGLHAEQVDELPEYQSVSVAAIGGLVLSLFAPLALIHGALIVIPIAAAILCLAALIWIRRSEGRLAGSTPAVIGLGLAFLFAAATPARALAWRNELHARATPIAMVWLKALQKREPHKAHQLTKPDLTRRPLTDSLWSFYARDAAARSELETFVEDQVVNFLLTLGEKAEIRYYAPAALESIPGGSQYISQYFAITYEDRATGRTTTFLGVTVERRALGGSSREQWRIASFQAVTPPDFASL